MGAFPNVRICSFCPTVWDNARSAVCEETFLSFLYRKERKERKELCTGGIHDHRGSLSSDRHQSMRHFGAQSFIEFDSR